ncbi:hypothetical protein RHSIM_Rhsim11G0064100 [Rhododendron simsii]|uniref:Uncharacterized protein n=1 Tax=Rhododendron simsii TaxID=118357 RepID=A0A834LB79_RHOSS|nr:hypothetical protein RHSIM_Rhsim11G0064100 [Rhododendron simsii]
MLVIKHRGPGKALHGLGTHSKEAGGGKSGLARRFEFGRISGCPNPLFFTVNRHTPRRNSIDRVSDLIDAGSKIWNTALVKECFNKEDSELILSIPISSTQRRDRKIWHSSSDGHFTVKSAYHLEKESSISRPESLVAQSSSTAMMSSIWKRLWGLSIQPEIKLSTFN